MNREINYLFPADSNKDVLLENLGSNYKVKNEYHWRGERIYFDTFDWRLYNKSCFLFSENNKIYLKSWGKNIQPKYVQIRRIPKFVWQIPDSALRRELEPILEVRALISLATILVDQQKFRILNKIEKTVAYLILENSYLSQGEKTQEIIKLVTLIPVRGFYDHYQNIHNLLKKKKFKEFQANLFENILLIKELTPGTYSSKVTIQLDPQMDAAEAVKEILSSLFNIIRRNEQGILEDIDTEFLHDYRVAVRKTRSAYGQLGNVFDAKIYETAKKDFSQLGSWTNRMRDIDVYNLKKNEYQNMLPNNMKKDIEPFFKNLNQERKIVHKNLVNKLTSQDYKQSIAYWERFLRKPVTRKSSAIQSKWSILEYASSIIMKRFKKVIKLGESITVGSPDELLHKLRIECKKLRYLLEFFASLFPLQHIVFLIKQLKILQDNLGDFNDLSVQQQTLQKFVEKETNKKTLLAVGMLIGKLNEKQTRVREAFDNTFQQFASPKMRKLFMKLFSSGNVSDKW